MMKKGNEPEGRGHILFNLALGHRRISLAEASTIVTSLCNSVLILSSTK